MPPRSNAPRKRRKPEDASTLEATRAAIRDAVRTGGGLPGLPVLELIEIVVSYVAPFVTTKALYKIGCGFEARFRSTVLDARDGESILTSGLRGSLYRHKIGESEAAVPVAPAVHFCGLEERGFAMGNRRTASFGLLTSVCRDPTNAAGTGFYIADSHSIRYFDEAKDAVSLIAGDASDGLVDGIGADARFQRIDSLIITSDGRALWVGERSGLRRVRVHTREVSTVWSGLGVTTVCWDRALTVQPESAVYCVEPEWLSLYRFDIVKSEAVRCDVASEVGLIGAVWTTPSGYLLLYPGDRYAQTFIHSYDPTTRQVERLDGLGTDVSSLAKLNETARTFVCTDSKLDSIVTYTLPPQFFALPKCCARDL